ncbi:Predicted nucleotidyltransferase [Gracilibacillus orientalis]|uniref:tRNA(Met) cytidine acetate ligase n=1 Tax=Gracilibacillus orientalis TaxID=334253 RepID=A0A1I4MAQ0_9BACI|nr:nucleotidyltransferase [Gracilibacillus orientalis]SFM00266.1 Predicted nucleotidyltransferase [Gracilibacillus orientalis]
MKACGLIVEYNPYHNGHHYHFQQAKIVSGAECMVAVMSGNFLQRGEPAIVDKFSRAKMAIQQGVDLVIELPYFYAVQHSELFANGAIKILNSLQVDSLCFGSEHGEIDDFNTLYHFITEHQKNYDLYLTEALNQGNSYPKANDIAFSKIGGENLSIDFAKPNNILGYQYVKNIYDLHTTIFPYTIKRIKNNYHDREINDPIASATSIRKQLLTAHTNTNTNELNDTIPSITNESLESYKELHSSWHYWEAYFPLLKYRVLTMRKDEFANIHGIKEGLENRIINTAKKAESFSEWMELLKTKRYTWTSLQRVFTHILTNTYASEIEAYVTEKKPSAIRILAMSKNGQNYLSARKKEIDVEWYTSNKHPYPYQAFDDRIDHAYYSILPLTSQQYLTKQAYQKPIFKTP